MIAPLSPAGPPPGPLAVEVRGLVKRFGDHVAVGGIDLSVGQGEIFGFLGPNGAGKTTTIKMLCTLLPPTAGTARVAGYDVATEPDAVRRAIGVLFQEPSLDERLTAEENLALHAVAWGVPRAERAPRVDEALRVVDLADRRHDLVRAFSGGMKRRLEIARGLLHRPRVLFLDEPTTGLDPQTRARTWEVLRSLRERHGVTLFLTTHYMEEAEHCDRIAVIDHGAIIELDTPEALKRRLGRDHVRLTTRAPEPLRSLLRGTYGLVPRDVPGGLEVAVEDGGAFVVGLLTDDRPDVDAVSLRRPSLDDVFLTLTGREIRAQAGEGNGAWRAAMRRRT